MESPAAYKFKKGYLPYTLSPILIIFALAALSNSWPASLAGGAIFLIISTYLIIFQLAIFHLPVESKENFHLYCLCITLFNMFITPAILGFLIAGLLG